MNELTDQVAVVTGASSGIGRAIAHSLALLGANVCLVGRNRQALAAVRENDPATAARVRCYATDLSCDEDLLELTWCLKRDFESIDVLVHSAGAFVYGPLETARVADLDALYRINVRAPYALTQALLPLLKPRRGQIVFVNSTVSLRNASAGSSQYTATKYALKAIADSLRDELSPQGLRVLSGFPGRTASPMQATVHHFLGKDYVPENLSQAENVAAAVIQAPTQPRTAQLTDITLKPIAS